MKKFWLTVAILGVSFPFILEAAPSHLAKGYIQNIDGEKCWYKQSANEDTYFTSLSGQTRTLSFDNPSCMSAEGLDFEVNVMMINIIIVRPYSHSDANFQTRFDEIKDSSLMQTKGRCVQSKTYSGVGVMVDYLISDGSITGVKHLMALQGCK